MISLKEYAEKNHITYEAVRKQVKRYEAELEGHITTENRKRCLDDYAEKFLDEKRNSNPIIIIEQSRNEQIETMTAQIIELQNRLIKRDEEVLQLQQQVMELQQQIIILKDSATSSESDPAEDEPQKEEPAQPHNQPLQKEKKKSWLRKLLRR